jgi:Uma2 family endonuclease
VATELLPSVTIPDAILQKLGSRMSDYELMRFSEENKPHRFERNKHGEITLVSPVGGISSIHEALVFAALFEWNKRFGHGVAFAPNAGFNLRDGSCLAPDAAWISAQRWNTLTPHQQAGFPPLCPDFLIEVRSLSDPRRPLETKMEQWLENGSRLAWLIDPTVSAVTIYRPDAAPETIERPHVVMAEQPVARFELVCDDLWPAR